MILIMETVVGCGYKASTQDIIDGVSQLSLGKIPKSICFGE